MTWQTRQLAAWAGILLFSSLCVSAHWAQRSLAEGRRVTIHRLYKLKNRTANHSTPDALVVLSPEFNRQQPINLLVYNHGLTDNLDKTMRKVSLRDAMCRAPANTVMFLPEWAVNPNMYSSNAGRFHSPGFFRKMLAEVMEKTPALAGYGLEDIRTISIMSYSGGYRAAASEIYCNGLEGKISQVVMFDSLYKGDTLDRWLTKNVRQLASGKKRYCNFFHDTRSNSLAQRQRLESMLSRHGIRPGAVVYRCQRGLRQVAASTLAEKPIVFKWTSLAAPGYHPHMNVPRVYLPKVIQAMAISRERALSKLARQPATSLR